MEQADCHKAMPCGRWKVACSEILAIFSAVIGVLLRRNEGGDEKYENDKEPKNQARTKIQEILSYEG